MPKTKIEVYDKDQLIYPFIESDHVTFTNGMKITEMLDQSISMPKVTHNETSFKVGVGDSDVSSSIVDSSVSKMVIKGQTYQNILPEPTLRNEMQGKSMQRLNEGYDNIEVVDGVSKSAILSGQTLVNVAKKQEKPFSHSADKTLQNNHLQLSHSLKANTTYTRYIHVSALDLGTTSNVMMYDALYGEDGSYSQYSYAVTSKGWIINTLTPKATSTNSYMINPDMNALSNGLIYIEIDKFMIIEGDYTNVDIPYFEGMQSVKMPVLTTTGKNLFDINHFSKLKNWDGNITAEKPYHSYKIKLKPNTTYTFSRKENSTGNNVYFCLSKNKGEYDFDGGIVHPNPSLCAQQLTITTDSTGILYLNLYQAYKELANLIPLLEDAQLEQGSTATPYEPYKSNNLSCQLAPLNQSMFEQGTFAESTPPNTQSYESIKLGSEHLYTTRIRTKGTYKVVQGATYEVQLNEGYDIFICYCKNGLYSATVNRWLDGTSTFTVPNDCDEMFFAIRKTDNTAISPSDYPLIGLKIHQEVVLRSLPNGVKDTLNLMTGEHVQRISEIVLDGGEGWSLDTTTPASENTLLFFTSGNYAGFKPLPNYGDREIGILCDKFKVMPNAYHIDEESMMVNQEARVYIRIAKSKLSTQDVSGFKAWLQSNNVKVSALLNTPVVKTVDLSSSGNWDMITLNGSEEGIILGNLTNRFFVPIGDKMYYSPSEVSISCSSFGVGTANTLSSGQVCAFSTTSYYKGLMFSMSNISTVDEFKKYLKSNPMTIVYKLNDGYAPECGFAIFSNGHIIQSSGADSSLIPTLDYQAKTSNSYVMDLMKTNTKYTMKAKSASDTFTIDGTSYGAGTNGTFTTPSSMTNKFLVMSNKTNEEVMILEGDVTDKTIPYFKGIKSAFEGEDKIEVLSTGKNLFDMKEFKANSNIEIISVDNNKVILKGIKEAYATIEVTKQLQPNTKYWFGKEANRLTSNSSSVLQILNSNNGILVSRGNDKIDVSFTTDDTGLTKFSFRVNEVGNTEQIEVYNIYLYDFNSTTYEPYKSNSTKIPLLSPLRSLPNGVKDEVILDRENNKAKIIQRVGRVVFNGSQRADWATSYKGNNTMRFDFNSSLTGASSVITNTMVCDKFCGINDFNSDVEGIRRTGTALVLRVTYDKLTTHDSFGISRYLSQNPMTVYYELATPIITEIDLEGFPYVYKDGHIFLNSEIAPTTQITYSINQAQQIESANENLQRHEKEISRLQKLIAQYIQVEYESTLLSLKI